MSSLLGFRHFRGRTAPIRSEHENKTTDLQYDQQSIEFCWLILRDNKVNTQGESRDLALITMNKVYEILSNLCIIMTY